MLFQLIMASPMFLLFQNTPINIEIPGTMQTEPGIMIQIDAKTNGRIVKWVKATEGCGLIPFPDGKTAIFSAPYEGEYTIIAYTALNDEPSEPKVCKVIVKKKGPPEPKPPAPPQPPRNELEKKLIAAYQEEKAKEKKAWTTAIGAFFEAMQEHLASKNEDGTYAVKTLDDLRSDYRKAIPTVIPKDALNGVKVICAEEIYKVTGDDEQKVINTELRQSLRDLFQELGTIMKKLVAMEGAR